MNPRSVSHEHFQISSVAEASHPAQHSEWSETESEILTSQTIQPSSLANSLEIRQYLNYSENSVLKMASKQAVLRGKLRGLGRDGVCRENLFPKRRQI